jgi:hypothetical protein
VRHLGSVGGKDVADTTRHVMRDLMTNIVAGRMNFIGRGGKTAIKNMKLLKVIFGKNIECIPDILTKLILCCNLRLLKFDTSGSNCVVTKLS